MKIIITLHKFPIIFKPMGNLHKHPIKMLVEYNFTHIRFVVNASKILERIKMKITYNLVT
jgi:hypothetical protein